ncbi:hypothetical protein QJS04_geneDACA023629 [Acorus gramineus]|uniref:DUF4283 domain-containing protein n=1 Tax=Acorus gramineus TaxID=55184 RepID=A0AAV8ZXP5_ACOGR|nr:hypothetical protein QJS04_geneDACA023629 [Acorus gramineus]
MASFVCKFELEDDPNHVLEGGPWYLESRPLIIKKWTPEVRLEQDRLQSIPIWIHLPELPFHYWSPNYLGKIGSIIGTPFYMDNATRISSWIDNARICVEINALIVCLEEVTVEVPRGNRESFIIIYESKPDPCVHYHTFGHYLKNVAKSLP